MGSNLNIIIYFFNIYLFYLFYTPPKKKTKKKPKHAPLFFDSPPKEYLFLQQVKWQTDSIIAPKYETNYSTFIMLTNCSTFDILNISNTRVKTTQCFLPCPVKWK